MRKTNLLFLSAALVAIATNAGFSNCGNSGSTQTGPCTDPCSCPGVNPFSAATSNEYRDVTDLEVWGGVGEHQLKWTRWANSRYIAGPKYFGQGQNWRHSYQWELADAGTDSSGRALLDVFHPNGWIY